MRPLFGVGWSYDRRLEPGWVRGVMDLHVHAGPDVFPRRENALAVIEKASRARMTGVVLKDHLESSVGTASLLNQQFPDTQVYGGVALNWGVGGLNPRAVDVALAKGAKIIWLPTIDAANHEATCGTLGGFKFQQPATRLPVAQGISILDEDGQLKPELRLILARMHGSGAVLATGHSSKPEIFALNRYIREHSLDINLLVNHVEFTTTRLSARDIRSLKGPKVWFETVYLSLSELARAKKPHELARLIRAVPEAQWIMSSDSGQPANPSSPDAMLTFARLLSHYGIPIAKLNEMAKWNPRQLLGIPETKGDTAQVQPSALRLNA